MLLKKCLQPRERLAFYVVLRGVDHWPAFRLREALNGNGRPVYWGQANKITHSAQDHRLISKQMVLGHNAERMQRKDGQPVVDLLVVPEKRPVKDVPE